MSSELREPLVVLFLRKSPPNGPAHAAAPAAWDEPILCPALYPHGGWAHPSSLCRCVAEARNFFAFCSWGVQERGRTGDSDAVVEPDAG